MERLADWADCNFRTEGRTAQAVAEMTGIATVLERASAGRSFRQADSSAERHPALEESLYCAGEDVFPAPPPDEAAPVPASTGKGPKFLAR